MQDKGALVFCDKTQEIYLPWWYDHYSKTNDYPVAIIDFGMSEKGKKWANSIGQRIEMEPVKLDLEPPPDFMLDEWKAFTRNDYLRARPIWLSKPFALQKTPFEHTVYLDLDCEVKADLEPLFRVPFGLVPLAQDTLKCWTERGITMPEHQRYNTGVLAYEKHCPIVKAWASMIEECSCHFWSEQEALMETLRQKEFTVIELPERFNAFPDQKVDDAHIIHHISTSGKLHIICEMLHKTCT